VGFQCPAEKAKFPIQVRSVRGLASLANSVGTSRRAAAKLAAKATTGTAMRPRAKGGRRGTANTAFCRDCLQAGWMRPKVMISAATK